MDYKKLAEASLQMRGSQFKSPQSGATRSVVSSPVSTQKSVLDDFVGISKEGNKVIRKMTGGYAHRVSDDTTDTEREVVKQKPVQHKVVDNYTAEDLLGLSRSQRRKYLGSLSPKSRARMLGEMNKIKDSKRVSDAIESMDGDVNQSGLINLAVLLNNIQTDDSEFSRKLLSECLEMLPQKYSDYAYYVLDGDTSDDLTDEDIEDIDVELQDIRDKFNIGTVSDSKRHIKDSVLDDVVEQPSISTDVDALLSGIGEYLKTGNIDKLSEVRTALTGSGKLQPEGEDLNIDGDIDEEDQKIQENTDDLFGEGADASTDESDTDADLFGDDTTGDESEDTEGSDDLFGDAGDTEDTEDSKEDVGFEDDGDVIEVPEGVDENVKNLVQELLDIFSAKKSEDIEDGKLKKICVNTKKFVTDSLDDNESTACEDCETSDYVLPEFVNTEDSGELIRVPLSCDEYSSLSSPEARELDIKSLMPTYSCGECNIERQNSRCIKTTGDDGFVMFWTPICGSVPETFPDGFGCSDVQSGYVPVDAFCQYATKLNQLDLVNPAFYKQIIESPVWCVSEDIDSYGLKAGDSIEPCADGEIKIFGRNYKVVC